MPERSKRPLRGPTTEPRDGGEQQRHADEQCDDVRATVTGAGEQTVVAIKPVPVEIDDLSPKGRECAWSGRTVPEESGGCGGHCAKRDDERQGGSRRVPRDLDAAALPIAGPAPVRRPGVAVVTLHLRLFRRWVIEQREQREDHKDYNVHVESNPGLWPAECTDAEREDRRQKEGTSPPGRAEDHSECLEDEARDRWKPEEPLDLIPVAPRSRCPPRIVVR